MQRTTPPRATWIPLAAAAWAFGHAAMTAYWAVGGTLGLGLLSAGIREQADTREPWFVALLAGVIAAKLAGVAIALALRRPDQRRPLLRKILLVLALAGGAGMALYGLAGILGGLATLSGIVEPADGEADAVLWYVLIWSPLWLLGGLLFLATGWQAREGGSDRLSR